jgi:hypothetical protein
MLGRGRLETYKGAVSEQLDAVLLAYISHAVERPCVNQRELYMKNIRDFFFLSGHRRAVEMETRRFGEIRTYLDLIGDDGTRTELRANLVCPDRIKVYETESVDVTVALDVLEVAQTGHITLIGVVLPIKLDGDWAFEKVKVCQLDRTDGTGRNRKV